MIPLAFSLAISSFKESTASSKILFLDSISFMSVSKVFILASYWNYGKRVSKEILETATLKEYLNSNHYLYLVTSPHPSTNIFYHLCLKTTESERVAVISTHKQFSTWRHKFLCIRLFRGFLDLRCAHRYLWETFPLRTGIVQKQKGSYPPCGSRGGVVMIALASQLLGPGSF